MFVVFLPRGDGGLWRSRRQGAKKKDDVVLSESCERSSDSHVGVVDTAHMI